MLKNDKILLRYERVKLSWRETEERGGSVVCVVEVEDILMMTGWCVSLKSSWSLCFERNGERREKNWLGLVMLAKDESTDPPSLHQGSAWLCVSKQIVKYYYTPNKYYNVIILYIHDHFTNVIQPACNIHALDWFVTSQLVRSIVKFVWKP